MIVLWAERTGAVVLKRGKTAEDCDDLDAGSSQADVGTFLVALLQLRQSSGRGNFFVALLQLRIVVF